MAINKTYKYFLYSVSQVKMRREVEKRLQKKFIPGKVLVNGVWKDYTEVSSKPNNNRFADTVVVAEGYIEDMRYITPRSTMG